MKYSAVTFPQTILCGKCGYQMHADDSFRLGQPVVIRCNYRNCEQYDIPLEFPVTVVSLNRVEEAANAA